jgi:hypothetical protein
LALASDLSFYLNDASALLRDSSNIFTSTAQLTRWINNARRDAAKYTGCIRILIAGNAPQGNSAQPGTMIPGAPVPGLDLVTSFQTIAGVELYPYDYANQFLRSQNAGVQGIIDVLDISVSWGASRPTLQWMPWGDAQAYCRSWNQNVTSYPAVWSCQGDGTRGKVFLYPVPSVGGQQAEMEWDVICTPKDLNSNDDFEVLPESYHEAIKYRAAALAFMASQRYADAQILTQQFFSSLGIDRAAAKRGATSDYYWESGLP